MAPAQLVISRCTLYKPPISHADLALWRIKSPAKRSGGPLPHQGRDLLWVRGGLTGKGRPMTLPAFNMRQLLEAGVHFGHQSHRWNPKMAPFIYGARNNIHIIDLTQTTPMLHQGLSKISQTSHI